MESYIVLAQLHISAGTYTVNAIDINGCTGSAASEIIIGPDAIDVNGSATSVSCTDEENGSISWAPTGGAEGFEVMVGDSTLTGFSYDNRCRILYYSSDRCYRLYGY